MQQNELLEVLLIKLKEEKGWDYLLTLTPTAKKLLNDALSIQAEIAEQEMRMGMDSHSKVLSKLKLHKLPLKAKLWLARILLHTFKGFGPTFYNDIILYVELQKWVQTEGRPTTSEPHWWINTH